jgi:excisionase family DNA binding protein
MSSRIRVARPRKRRALDRGNCQPLLATPEEAAACLSLGRTTVYQLMRTGELHSVRIRGARRVLIADLEAFVAHLTNSETVLTVNGLGLPDDQPSGDEAPKESGSHLPMDH